MDIFSDDEPDLMGLELVREFDNLTKKFYSIFDDDLIELGEGTELYLGIRGEMSREELIVVIRDSNSGVSLNRDAKPKKITRRMEPELVSTRRSSEMTSLSKNEDMKEDSSEDLIVTVKNIKLVLPLPINNKKENIKVVVHDDNSVTITYLNYDVTRCTHTSEIPHHVDFETAKATYKNGVLEVTFDRQ